MGAPRFWALGHTNSAVRRSSHAFCAYQRKFRCNGLTIFALNARLLGVFNSFLSRKRELDKRQQRRRSSTGADDLSLRRTPPLGYGPASATLAGPSLFLNQTRTREPRKPPPQRLPKPLVFGQHTRRPFIMRRIGSSHSYQIILIFCFGSTNRKPF